jgi:retron-type reverse transcriptase
LKERGANRRAATIGERNSLVIFSAEQMAAKLVIEPIFEADFQPCSYGFRPKRSATQALEAIRVACNQGYNFVVDADIQGYFDNIQRDTLMELVKERVSDRRVLKLILVFRLAWSKL